MRITILIEGVILLVLGVVAMAGGLRLVIYKDPHVLYDPLGPGPYIAAIGVGLMAIGVVYLVRNYRKSPTMDDVPVDRKTRIRIMSTIATCALYIFLIHIVGYLLATIIFFFLEFRIEGIKSWPLVVVLSLVLSALYYFIFVQSAGLVFPRGIFFT
jgi:hypothetical protein